VKGNKSQPPTTTKAATKTLTIKVKVPIGTELKSATLKPVAASKATSVKQTIATAKSPAATVTKTPAKKSQPAAKATTAAKTAPAATATKKGGKIAKGGGVKVSKVQTSRGKNRAIIGKPLPSAIMYFPTNSTPIRD